MLSISTLEEIQSTITQNTTHNHNNDLELCQSGINLLFEAFSLLENMEISARKEDDYRLIIWGYLGTTINTLTWCLKRSLQRAIQDRDDIAKGIDRRGSYFKLFSQTSGSSK